MIPDAMAQFRTCRRTAGAEVGKARGWSKERELKELKADS
jgi:hypothetical protein